MKYQFFTISILIVLLLLTVGCYTQLKYNSHQTKNEAIEYYDEEYYDYAYIDNEDTTRLHTVTNIYYLDSYWYDPWYWDPWYADPWYWGPRRGLYVSFSYGMWDPYWYPWGWYGRCCYPYVSAYPRYYPYYWDYYYPPVYAYTPKNYQKRPWDRRSSVPVRQITRASGRTNVNTTSGGASNDGVGVRKPRYAVGEQSETQDQSRIIRTNNDNKRRITRLAGDDNSSSLGRSDQTTINTRSVQGRQRNTTSSANQYKTRSSSNSSNSKSYSPRSSSRRSNSGSYKSGKSSRSSSSGSYSSGRSSRSRSSGSSVNRSSGGSRSSSSGSRSSNSGSSRSSSRSSGRK